MNNICVIDDSLSNEECDVLIKEFNSKIQGSLEPPWNYDFYDVPFGHTILEKLSTNILNKYKKDYPEINLTEEKWYLTKFRYKVFKPGKYYDQIHSEQSFKDPRVLSILVYLSDHNCGTEFYNGCMVKSVKGRSLLFPPYWTHAHKGQPCPDNKERYILSAYGVFNKP
jgi:hypothetical protein|tara:strand:+ start:680 stop:1183 length:504 start_codon:yes stop_codon:yes gene_type:complete